MLGEFRELESDRKKQTIKKFSILSTSGVFKAKVKPNYIKVLVNGVFFLSIAGIAWYFVGQFDNYTKQDDLSIMYNSVNAEYEAPETTLPITEAVVEEPVLEPLVLLEGAKALLAENPDTVGYIKIDGTKTDNVVVQGEDDEFYLDHDFYGKKSQPGTIFVDSRCIIGTHDDSDNLIIYGHNQKSGRMFGELDLYKWDETFWLYYPTVQFNTNYEESEYVIVASFVTNELPEHDNGNVFDYYNYIYFNSKFTFEDWYSEIMERTMFHTGIECTKDDRYITLSTCSSEWEPSRHVIIARKVRENEEISLEGYKWNDNPKYPQIYYDVFGGSWE